MQIGLFFDNYRTLGAARCPIFPQGVEQVDLHPDRRSDGAGEPRKAQAPLRDVLEEAQQQVRQQPDPDLPPDSPLVVADEVGEL